MNVAFAKNRQIIRAVCITLAFSDCSVFAGGPDFPCKEPSVIDDGQSVLSWSFRPFLSDENKWRYGLCRKYQRLLDFLEIGFLQH